MDDFYNNENYDNGFQKPENKIPDDFEMNPMKMGFSIASFVISLVNLLCCFFFSFIAAPLSIIFAVIALATHRGGKGFAVAGLVISSVTLIFVGYSQIKYGEMSRDFVKFLNNGPAYVQQYENTGEVPEEFQKYYDIKYDEYWEAFEVKNFDEAYAGLIYWYKKNIMEQSAGTVPPQNNDDGSELVDISIRRATMPVYSS